MTQARGRVGGGEGSDGDEGGGVNGKFLARGGAGTRDRLVGEDENHGGDIESRAAGEGAGGEEEGGGGVAGGRPKPDLQKLVNRNDAEVVERFNEDEGDDHARKDGPDGKLGVGEVAQGVPFAGRAEKGGGADFRGEDRGEDCPPGDAAVAHGEALEGAVATAEGQADGEDRADIGRDHRSVEEERHRPI